MSLKYFSGVVVLLISLASAFLVEGINWLVIYRFPEYRSLNEKIAAYTKKLETLKAAPVDPSKKDKKKKQIDEIEKSLKEARGGQMGSQMKSSLILMFVLGLIYNLLSTAYDGKVVAKLPFVPFDYFKGWTHRGLLGDDPTETNMSFLYALASMVFRQAVNKCLGFSAPRPALPEGLQAEKKS